MKTGIKYIGGVLLLVLAAAAALWFPQWYCDWKDQQLFSQVQLESRENIKFLDTKTLDIAGRIQLLSEAQQMGWFESATEAFGAEQEVEVFLERCRKTLEKWEAAGLVPEDCTSWIQDETGEILADFYVSADNTAYEVYIMRFGTETGELLTFAIDAELELIYYLSLVEPDQQEAIVKEFYETIEQLENGYEVQAHPESYEHLDFAAVCGAQEAFVKDTAYYPELTITLQYDTFTAEAYRTIVENDRGCAYAYSFGTESWGESIEEMIRITQERWGLDQYNWEAQVRVEEFLENQENISEMDF